MKRNKRKEKKKSINKKVMKEEPFYVRNWYLIILVLVVIIYGKAVNFDFIYLDDDKIILDNYNKISSFSNITESFSTGYGFSDSTPYYRPIIMTSFILDAQFSDKNPSFYHISNIFIHFLTTCFLFIIFCELGIKKSLSLFLSLLFAVHPLLTNAVVWIAGRNDLIATLFGLLSFRYFINYSKNSQIKYFILHSIFFLIAIFSKEVSLVLPLLLLTYMFLYNREKFKWRYLRNFIFLWVSSIAIFQIIKMNVINEIGNVTYGIPALFANIRVIPEIIYKVFIPINISVLPTFTITGTITGAAIFLIIILLPFILKGLNWKKYFFGLIWFLIFILPGLAILYADQGERFDYLDTRIYLPIIGILLIIGEVLSAYQLDFLKKKSYYIGIALVLVFSILTFFQSNKYENAIVFAESAVESNPERAFFYLKLADYYFGIKSYKEAIYYIKIAIEKNPKNFVYYKNLILAYANLGQYDNAIKTINQALILKPNDLELIRGLVIMYYHKGDFKNALLYADEYVSLGGVLDPVLYRTLKEKAN